MASKLLVESKLSDPADEGSPSYSCREVEVLTAVAKGMSSEEVGAELSMSEEAAENHVRNSIEKLHRGTR